MDIEIRLNDSSVTYMTMLFSSFGHDSGMVMLALCSQRLFGQCFKWIVMVGIHVTNKTNVFLVVVG